MKLNRIDIINYRSIKELSIKMDDHCLILAGINESGKTNILSALSLLSEDEEPSIEDVRECSPDEDPVDESYIRFVFKLEYVHHHYMFLRLEEKILLKDTTQPIANGLRGKKLTISDICSEQKEGLFRVNVIESTKYPQYWTIKKTKYKLHSNFKKPSSTCPSDYKIAFNGEDTLLCEVKLLNIDDFDEIPDEYLVEADSSDLIKLVGAAICNVVKVYLPTCIFWKYTENNLLPGRIETSSFQKDPTSCTPLQNMFFLAGINEINDTISEAKERANGMRNLLNRIATITTKHIREVWKEHKDISIYLAENGDNIEAGVKDKFNVFDFNRRSDGFKRFITFLLLISARERVENLQDTIILIDEPDIALHPSGSKYLRDELIKISHTNTVIFSTHSIFMIDKSNIGRHLIVSKENEITNVEKASVSNMFDEEVIYNAMGHSIFENLKQKNIIFEGWRDKFIFSTAIRTTSKKHKPYMAPLKKIGVCNAQGVKDIPRVSATLELASRNCLIISDNDKAALQHKQNYKGYGNWLTYNDLDENCNAITGEDFVKISKIKKALKPLQEKFNITVINETKLKDATSRIDFIAKWLKDEGLNGQDVKYALNEFKTNLYDSLKPIHIEDSFYQMIKKIPDFLN